MKSTLFAINLKDPNICSYKNIGDNFIYTFHIPTLGAYAVDYSTLNLGGSTLFPDYSTIDGDNLKIHTKFSLEKYQNCYVTIHYHGIRKYSLLFPNVTPSQLQERLGMFYSEAETAFENASWLTFMLMCGAIFEGILYSKIHKKNTFKELIESAFSTGIIDKDAEIIMNKVRNYRNIVHANKHTDPYVDRADAMDTRHLLDSIIKAT